MVRVRGGFANRMYRLDTDRGSFAVKELNLVDRRWTYHVEDVFRFERAAFAAGIPMPEPISTSQHTLVHRWVEAEQVPEAPVSLAYGFEIGEVLARIHALDVEWTHGSVEEPASQDWPELAERAAATGQPWADELAAHVETFLAIAQFVDTCERPGPAVLTHKDIQPWNLLAREGRPVVLDWELSGVLDLAGELGSTALSLAKGPGFDGIEPAVLPFHRRRLRRGGRGASAPRSELVRVHDRRLARAHEVERAPLPRRRRGGHRTGSHAVARVRAQRPAWSPRLVRPDPTARGAPSVTRPTSGP
jgi:aminoglycoside phosphotransferase (APT) family kinase protein